MTNGRTTWLVSAAAVALLAVAATGSQLPGSHLSAAGSALASAEWHWIMLGALGFVAAFACTAAAWRAAFAAAGGDICPKQVAARIGVGSLVNALAPAKLGDAVKVALCSRAIDTPDRLWTAGGVYAALAATRSLALALLVGASFAVGAMPIWPLLLLLGVAAIVGLVATVSPSVRKHARLAHLVSGLRSLLRSPRTLARVLAWSLGMEACKLLATAAVATALDVPHPFLAALVILPALGAASIFPLTPGGLGIGSGAVAVMLAGRGIGVGQALGVGLAVQATESLVSVSIGSCGLLYLAGSRPVVRTWLVRSAALGAAVLVAALGAYLGLHTFDLT